METLSCHTMKARATAIKNIMFVEAYVMNISTKFQLASEEKIFEYFFTNLAFPLPWQPIKFSGWTKFVWMVGDYSRNISVKLLSEYLQ